MPGIETWSAASAEEIISAEVARCLSDERAGAVLPILHGLQHRFGYIHQDAADLIADALNLSRAEVFGTISFYPDFRRTVPGQHVIKLCRAEACQSLGADALHDQCRRILGIDWHGTTPDGRITLEPVFCLGLCAIAPVGCVDDRLLARLDGPKTTALIEELTR